MSLGKRALQRRQDLEITQQNLARALGITPQHISLIEQNKASPSVHILAGLATELGVSIDYLVSGKEGIITDVIPAIKADKILTVKSKNALIALVEELYTRHDRSETASKGDY